MRRFIVVLLGALLLATPVAMPAFADFEGISATDIGLVWDKLDDTAKAEALSLMAKQAKKIERAAVEAATPDVPLVTVEEVEPWLNLIDHLGAGLVKLAHDLGVEANTLVSTPVGMMAMGLVAYHVMGPEVLDLVSEVVIGVLWFHLTMPLLLILFFKGVVPIESYVEVKARRSLLSIGTGDRDVVRKPIRRKMEFGDGFSVDYVFTILLIVDCFVTLAIIC